MDMDGTGVGQAGSWGHDGIHVERAHKGRRGGITTILILLAHDVCGWFCKFPKDKWEQGAQT